MQICEHCFDSKSVSNFIINTAVKLSVPILCNECHSISEYRLESMFLKDQVQKIILKHYEYSEDLLISAALYAKEEDALNGIIAGPKGTSICLIFSFVAHKIHSFNWSER